MASKSVIVEGGLQGLQRAYTADPKTLFDQAAVSQIFNSKVAPEPNISPHHSPRRSQLSENSFYSEYTDIQYKNNFKSKKLSTNVNQINLENLKDDPSLTKFHSEFMNTNRKKQDGD